MSEPRHATVMCVMGVLDLVGGNSFNACDGRDKGPAVFFGDSVGLRNGALPAFRRITCERCAVIVDAALEGMKPFPFSLPGVPDEVLR